MEDWCKTYEVQHGRLKIERGRDLVAGSCSGYMLSTLEWMKLMQDQQIKQSVSRSFCMDSPVDADQLRRVYLNFVHEHPARLNEPATSVALSAVVVAFPCSPTETAK
jgi:hypothetical protein